MNILVLGAGLIGAPMARDLALDRENTVTVADISQRALQQIATSGGIQTVRADLTDAKALDRILAPCAMVINAVPGFMGYATLKAIIEAGKNVIDIAFFPEDPFALDELAKRKGVTAAFSHVAAETGRCGLHHHASHGPRPKRRPAALLYLESI